MKGAEGGARSCHNLPGRGNRESDPVTGRPRQPSVCEANSLWHCRGKRMIGRGDRKDRRCPPGPGAKVTQSIRTIVSTLSALSLLLLVIPIASAQSNTASSSLATLDAPPTGTAPPGDALRPGHLGRQIEN